MNDYTLRLGNCSDILPEYAGQANLILTSPPYDNLRDYGGHGFQFDPVADACVTAMAPGGVLVWVVADETVDGSESGTSFRQALGFMERGLLLNDTMIFEKATPMYGKGEPRYAGTFAYMFILTNGKPAVFNAIIDRSNRWAGESHRKHHHQRRPNGERNAVSDNRLVVPEFSKRTNIWRYAVGKGHVAPDFPDAHKHPAIFPYQLAVDHIKSWTSPGDLVIDPMAGSGTTLRAAMTLGRRVVGIEIEQFYFGLIERRMSQLVLVDSGV